MKFPIGLQPYTIRHELEKDYLGSLKKVAEIGYKGIELGPTELMTTKELKKHLDDYGLQVIGCHADLESLTNEFDELIDYLHYVGGSYLSHSSKFDSRQSVLESALVFNKIGEACKKQGVQFLYHNHNWEFTKFDGEYALDILLNETNPEYVKVELDTYWVMRGGEDPVDYLRKLENRCPLLHIKDMEAGEEQFFAEIGEGCLDFVEIAKMAKAVGTQWFVVEQDLCRRSPFESIKISYENLRKLGLIEE